MVLTLDLVLTLLALICFFLAAISVPTGRLSLVAAGLFLWLLSTVV